MNKEVKEKWLKALKSKDYQQGQKLLRSLDNKYCCLGVLCDLYAREQNHTWSLHNELWLFGSEELCSLPSKEVSAWAGIDLDISITLARLNDSGLTFEQIAEHIEANY